MHTQKSNRTPFRYDYSLPVIARLVAGPVVVALAIATVACAVAVTSQWRRGGAELFDVMGLGAVAVLCTFGVVAWILGWMERASWSLGVDGESLYWSSQRWGAHRKETRIRCADVAAITIRTFGDWPDMTVNTADGTSDTAPSKCLGDLDRFCQAIHTFAPQAIVTFDGFATCEVCGKPTRTKRATLRFEDGAAPRYFCKLHRT